MCYFILVAMPERSLNQVQPSVPRGLSLISIENRSLSISLREEDRLFVLTSGGCSCDLYRGAAGDSASLQNAERLRRKHAKQGWSQEKIDRAIRQSLESDRRKETSDTKFVGLRRDVIDWLKLAACTASRIGVLVHWFDDAVDDEKIAVRNPQTIDVENLDDFAPETDRWSWLRS